MKLSFEGVPLISTDWGYLAYKKMTFAGGTANDPGDYDGTGNPATLFTVSGTCKIRLLAVGHTDLVGAAATIIVGTSKDTDALIASTTATDIDAMEIWHDNAPDNSVELASVVPEEIVAGGDDIIQTVGAANITAGVIEYMCWWYPLSPDGEVVAAQVENK